MSTNATAQSANTSPTEKGRSPLSRRSSWDQWEDFNPAEAKDARLRFAKGDAGTNKFSRFYLWAVNRNILVRWALYIIPVVAIIWVAGIIDLVLGDGAHVRVWGVRLHYWSIWCTIAWCTFWGSKAFFMIFPHIWKQTVAAVAPSTKKYTGVVANLGKYFTYLIWTICMNIPFTLVISNNSEAANPSQSRSALTWIANILKAFIFCAAVLCAEKLVIQLIALSFHRDAYADRIKDQKQSFKALTTLYIHSQNVPGTNVDDDAASINSKASQMPRIVLRKALRGLKSAAQSTTTALGNVASEMAGTSVLQTNSPQNKVTAAIASANKSKALARRLFYSFRKPSADHLAIDDIARFFPDLESAEKAFEIFDRDGNGDATRDEMDAALMEIHRERMALEASIRDLDGAVSRLDEILLIIVLIIDILICLSLTAAADDKFQGWISSTSTFVLSLSWMIGTTAQEILLSCIFVFVKHPYDVGDRVDIDGQKYTVAKVELLSTAFKRIDGKFVWIGHNQLWTKVIENIRRSGPISESFEFSVAFATTFDQLQNLRAKMLRFCKENPRDFLPQFDVTVADMPDQAKLVLNADIKYKSNWQLGALKVQRRNKWVCQLKMVLAELRIWGPADAGDPNPPPPPPTRFTMVPWEDVLAQDNQQAEAPSTPPSFRAATTANLHSRHDSSTDIWGERYELNNETLPGTPGTNTPMAGTPPLLHGSGAVRAAAQAYPEVPGGLPHPPFAQQQGYFPPNAGSRI